MDIYNANNMFITGDIHLFHNNICERYASLKAGIFSKQSPVA